MRCIFQDWSDNVESRGFACDGRFKAFVEILDKDAGAKWYKSLGGAVVYVK